MRTASSIAALALALIALLLAGSEITPTATASPESRASARATAAEVTAVVAELRRLRGQGASADPAAVRAAGADLQRVTVDARALLQGYLDERGPVGDLGESAVVVGMVKGIETGTTLLRQMTGVNAAPRTTTSQRRRVQRRAAGIIRALVAKRAAELGLGDVVRKGPQRAFRDRAERRVRQLIARESPNILVEATAASLFFGTSAQGESDRLIRERVSGLVARIVVKGDPLRLIAFRLVGADRIVEGAVRKVLPIASWGPRQIVRFIRRIGRLNLSQRARRSTNGLRALAARLRTQGRTARTAKEAAALVRRAERAAARAVNLRDELARAGRRGLLGANTRALAQLGVVRLTIKKRFGLGTELFDTRRALRNRLAAFGSEIEGMLRGWDGTVRTGSGGGAGGGGATAGRATQASCLGPIQVDTGVFDPNVNDYAVTSVESRDSSILCQYTRTDDPSKGGPGLTIWFGPENGRCGDPSADPVRDGTGTRHSTKRTISAILVWGGSWRLAGPEGWAENVIRAAEAEGAGRLCPRGAPL